MRATKWYFSGNVSTYPDQLIRGKPVAALSQSVGKLDEASRLPLYQQLQRALRQAIETRVLGPDDALPPERDLAADFNVSRITVR